MKWNLTMPCADCPFRKKGGIRLRAGRIRELWWYATDSQGAMFPCHKTTDREKANASHEASQCAGALALAEKLGKANQAMRMMERLDLYDYRKITQEAKDAVWDSLEDWTTHGNVDEPVKRRKRSGEREGNS